MISSPTTRHGTLVRPDARGGGARTRTPNLLISTVIICTGLILTGLILPDESPNLVFRTAAVGVGLSLALAMVVELHAGLRALLRTDLVMLVALYVLTFLEFLFPQPSLNLHVASAVHGTNATLLGFGGLAIGRHLVSRRVGGRRDLSPIHMSPAMTMRLFVTVFLLGYLHIFYAVGFDLFEALRQMGLPRFSQAWARGRLGGWPELLNEIGALIYLIPPLAGFVFARSRNFGPVFKLFVALVLLLTLYYGFAGGTRNVFAVYFVTLLGSYFSFQRRFTLRQVLLLGLPAVFVLGAAMYYMLEFRKVGLADYSASNTEKFQVFVDYNLVNISNLTEVFPKAHSFLGWEVPYIAVIRPIPRAIWPGKPTGLSLTIEDALGARGYTLATTFIGEAYMAGGFLAIAIAGLLFGAAAAHWNQVGQDVRSNFKLILYASGFFCAAITMRSFMMTTVAALPTIGLWFMGKLWIRQPKRRVLVSPAPRLQRRQR